MYYLRILAYLLVIIGAINWGFIGFMNIDFVSLLFGEMSVVSRVVYCIVGVSAIISLITTYRCVFYKYE